MRNSGDNQMHMANELLSLPVAAGTLTLAAGALGGVCRKLSKTLDTERLSLMGVLAAFVFAAQMINIPLPGLPGTSGHMIGAVLLAILLGPHAGALAISSVVIIQCLLFQDGGLLALGCNLINLALIPTYLGYALYRSIAAWLPRDRRRWIATLTACLITVETGAVLVVLQAGLSGVVTIPLRLFLLTMLGVHFVVGLMEGILTISILGYLQRVRPELCTAENTDAPANGTRKLLLTVGICTLLVAGLLSLWASDRPDGLEWSYADRPDQPEFVSVVHNDSAAVAKIDALQEHLAPLPDYSIRRADAAQAAAGWTSFAGVVGSLITMAALWLGARLLRGRRLSP
jgi:cobalt/nickel transport system permease protein